MKVSDLLAYLNSEQCPKDAKVVVYDDSVVPHVVVNPQVVWWSDDRETVYLGML